MFYHDSDIKQPKLKPEPGAEGEGHDRPAFPAEWEHKRPTAYDIIAACLKLKEIKEKIYVDPEGRHFYQTKYGFVPVEQKNLFLENRFLEKKISYQSSLIEKHRDTEDKLLERNRKINNGIDDLKMGFQKSKLTLKKEYEEILANKHNALSLQSATILKLKDEIKTLKRLIETQNAVMSVNSRIESAIRKMDDVNFVLNTKRKLIELQSSINRLQLKTSKHDKELGRVIDMFEVHE